MSVADRDLVTDPSDHLAHLSPSARVALAWVMRLQSGEATKAELAQLAAWRAETPENERSFVEAARLWKRMKSVAADVSRSEQAAGLSDQRRDSPHWMPNRRAVLGGAVAAAVGVYIVRNPPLDLWPSINELQADFRTSKGERRELAAAPDVTLMLNTQSSLIKMSAPNENLRLALVAGEVAIVSKRNAGAPLTVEAAGLRVVADQSSFNIRCLDREVAITCVAGEIAVSDGKRELRVGENEQVRRTAESELGSALRVNPEKATAWQRGLLIVASQPLNDVVAEVNRYRAGRIFVVDGELGRHSINGTFHLDRLDNFPDQVRQLLGASIRHLPGGIVLLG
jgi:transmembrane sensor